MSTFTKRVCTSNEDENGIKRGPWTLEEDSLLIHYIASHGEGRWNMLAKRAGLKRTGKSCRLRWLNYLRPDIKRGNLTPQEQLLILELHAKWGNRWSKIAQQLPGRTDNEIKNYWRTRVQKQARQLNIESGSKKFLDAVRCFWMPRLLQKIDQTSSNHYSLITMDENPAYFSTSPTVTSLSTSSTPVGDLTGASNQFKGNLSSMSIPIIPSPDSMQISQLPEISEHTTSPSNAFDNNVYNNSIHDSCYVDTNSYNMEGFNLGPMSAIETYDISQFDFHMANSEWVMDNMTDTLWNMDTMSQFRQ